MISARCEDVMAKDKITARTLGAYSSKASASGKALYLWDTARKGFGCYISASGAVSFVMQHWAGGREGKATRITLGKHPPMSLDQACKAYDEAKGAAALGVDIGTRQREQKGSIKAAIKAGTLEEAFEAYAARKAKPGKHWMETKRLFCKDILPGLGHKTPIGSIKKVHVRELIEAKEVNAPGVARYMFAVLRPFFAWVADRELIPSSPMADLVPPSAAEKRERTLSDAEIRAVWQGCEGLGWPFGFLYRLLLLTGQRREEVSAMRWDELDLDEATWTIPRERTKNNKEHVVHLSAQALGILQALPRIEGTPFVFTTTGTTAVSGYSKAKHKLDTLAGEALGKALKPYRVHDFRRTAASGMARLGIPPEVVERVINHISGAQGGLKGIYQRYDYASQRRDALGAWGDAVETIVSGAKANNVVAIRQMMKV